VLFAVTRLFKFTVLYSLLARLFEQGVDSGLLASSTVGYRLFV